MKSLTDVMGGGDEEEDEVLADNANRSNCKSSSSSALVTNVEAMSQFVDRAAVADDKFAALSQRQIQLERRYGRKI